MRFLKRILLSVLIYIGVFYPFCVIVQAMSGVDLTPAYAIGGASATVELILCSLIKREENKNKTKGEKKDD